MNAHDHLTAAVAEVLTSGYCPASRALFLLRLLTLVSFCCAAGCALVGAARFARANPSVERAAVLGGIVLIVFAIGAGALDLFGLSGCGDHTIAGLEWDLPW